MITYLLDAMPAEVEKVVIAAGYKVNMLKDFFSNKSYSFKLIIEEETKPLGTAGGLKNCESHCAGYEELLVFNGDVISSLNLREFINAYKKSKCFGAISLWPVSDPSRYGLVDLDENNRIIRFMEKPEGLDISKGNYLINSGTYIFKRRLFDLISPGKKISIEHEIFPNLIDKGLLGFPFSGYWIDAGTAEDYINAHRVLFDSPLIYTELEQLELLQKLRKRFPDAVFKPPVFAGDNLNLQKGCVLGPNAILGDNISLDENIRIRNSVVMNGTTVGSKTKLDSVIIGYDNVIGKNCELKNFLITADNTNIEDETKTN